MNGTHLKTSDIIAGADTQPRETLDPSVVQDYVSDMQGGAEFRPVVAFSDGTHHWLADGFHRLEAYRQLGHDTILAEVRRGKKRDAILFACGANASHAYRRTKADKKRSVQRLLNDPEWSQRSDRWIAETCRVSHTTVGTLRASTGHLASCHRLGRDGRMRKVHPPPDDVLGQMVPTKNRPHRGPKPKGKTRARGDPELRVLSREEFAEAQGAGRDRVRPYFDCPPGSAPPAKPKLSGVQLGHLEAEFESVAKLYSKAERRVRSQFCDWLQRWSPRPILPLRHGFR